MRVMVMLLVMAVMVFGDWKSNEVVITPDTIAGIKLAGEFDGGIAREWRVVAKANDTAAAAFKNDSVRFSVQYKLGSVVKDANGKSMTLWGTATVLDTFKMYKDSFNVDTTSVNGYGVKNISIASVDTAQKVMFFIQTLAGNRVGKRVGNIVLEVIRWMIE